MFYVATIPRNVSRSMNGCACLAFILEDNRPIGKVGIRFSSESEDDIRLVFDIKQGCYQLRIKFQDKTEYITQLYPMNVVTQADFDRVNDNIEEDYKWWLTF